MRSDWGNTTMPEWFDGVAQELSLIGAAPISFATALVVLIIVVWAILHWFYHRMLSSKDIQIEVLQSRLADYRNVLEGASPREAAYKITQLCVERGVAAETPVHVDHVLLGHAEAFGDQLDLVGAQVALFQRGDLALGLAQVEEHLLLGRFCVIASNISRERNQPARSLRAFPRY
jgi:hypothetical protein